MTKLTPKQKEVVLAMRERKFGMTNRTYYIYNADGRYKLGMQHISKFTISSLINKGIITTLCNLTELGKTIEL